jgi:type II secretory pathway pseudopilin PulG
MTVRARDGGESLIELMIAMVVVGLAVTAILGGLGMAVATSTMTRDQARVQALLGSWAESISATTDTGGYAYAPCASAGSFPGPPPLPPGFSGVVTGVTYWDGAAWAGTCATDTGVQKVRLRITSPAALLPGLQSDLDVVVRRPCGMAPGESGAC